MPNNNRVKRGKSNIETPYTNKLDPDDIETGGIKVNIDTDYTPSPERLAREAEEAQKNNRQTSAKIVKRGMFKNDSSEIWNKLGDDTQYIGETDWEPLESKVKVKDNENKPEKGLHSANSNEKPNFWDGLSDDIEYMGDTDWSEFRKKPIAIVEADIDDSKTDGKRKTRARRTGKSKSASTFSIRKCKKCMLDCEYGAYLSGAPMNRSFVYNKSTCPKR